MRVANKHSKPWTILQFIFTSKQQLILDRCVGVNEYSSCPLINKGKVNTNRMH